MKYVIVLALAGIVASLGVALFHMLKRQPDTQPEPAAARRMARALALRVGLSVALLALVLLGSYMGWLQPGGIPLR